MSADRSVRFLSALGQASTSRVLNLIQIARANKDNPEHSALPLFRSPIVNQSFVLKHRMRTDESYLFHSSRAVATKLIVPFDTADLKAGGRSVFVDQRGFLDSLRALGCYGGEALERDLMVLRLLAAVPSLDPFLLREHLRNNDIEVAPCYFALSLGDQQRMQDFVTGHMQQLIQLATGGADNQFASRRMVAALLSNRVDEKLEPLRVTLGLSGADFREGVFSWRGFLYYKWSIADIRTHLIDVLRDIRQIEPQGAMDSDMRMFLAGARRNLIEMVRDGGDRVNRVLKIYDDSFAELVADQAPKTFRDFLLGAPYMFLELGEKMGAISHIVSFWRYRFPPLAPKLVDAEELAAIFQDFLSGFPEGDKGLPAAHQSQIKRPEIIAVD